MFQITPKSSTVFKKGMFKCLHAYYFFLLGCPSLYISTMPIYNKYHTEMNPCQLNIKIFDSQTASPNYIFEMKWRGGQASHARHTHAQSRSAQAMMCIMV